MFWNKVKKRRYGIALFGALLVLCVFALYPLARRVDIYYSFEVFIFFENSKKILLKTIVKI